MNLLPVLMLATCQMSPVQYGDFIARQAWNAQAIAADATWGNAQVAQQRRAHRIAVTKARMQKKKPSDWKILGPLKNQDGVEFFKIKHKGKEVIDRYFETREEAEAFVEKQHSY